MNADRLLGHYERIADAPDAVPRLRRFILDLAVRGKLVEQDPEDESPAELLGRISERRSALLSDSPRRKGKQLKPIQAGYEPFPIPNSWVWTRLGEVAELVRGISFPASDKSTESAPDRLPCFRSGNIQSKITWSDFIYVPKTALKGNHQLVCKDDILISIANSYELVGKSSIIESIPNEATFGAFLAAIRLLELSPNYMRYSLGSGYSSDAFRVGSSQTTNIANITFSTIRNHIVPIPPLAEQHRIVAKVDELMALCDRLEAARTEREATRDRMTAASLIRLNDPDPEVFQNHAAFALDNLTPLTTRRDQIKALRQTILNLAVRGKLVPQDPNDEPASELVKRIAKEKARLAKAGVIGEQKALPSLANAKTSFDLPQGWVWTRLGHLSQLVTSGSRDWAKHYSNEGAIFLRMGNLSKDHYHLRLEHIQRVKPPANSEGTRTRLEDGDICISITGDVGMLGLIPEGFSESYINQHTALVRPMPELKGRYLAEMFRSPFAQQQFNEPQRGIKNSFRLSDVTQFAVPLPPLAEQRRIVANVDRLLALCAQLEARLTSSDQARRLVLEALLQEALAPSAEIIRQDSSTITQQIPDKPRGRHKVLTEPTPIGTSPK